MFVEMFEMEIVEKKGTSCRRLMGHRVDFVKVEKRPVGTSVASQKVALSALG
jgi:hypothetical protein